MGEVGETIPEKPTIEATTIPSAVTITDPTTTSINLTNGELQNGTCKTIDQDNCKNDVEKMDIDTEEDDSQISSSECGVSQSSDSHCINNLKQDLLKIVDDRSDNKILTETESEESQPVLEKELIELSDDSICKSDETSSKLKELNKNGSLVADDDVQIKKESIPNIKSTEVTNEIVELPSTLSKQPIKIVPIIEKTAEESMEIDDIPPSVESVNNSTTTLSETKLDENNLQKQNDDPKIQDKVVVDGKITLDKDVVIKTVISNDESDDIVMKETKNEEIVESEISKNVITTKTSNKIEKEEIVAAAKDSIKSPDTKIVESVEISKTNGDVTKVNEIVSQSKPVEIEVLENNLTDDIQVIESDDDEDPFRDIPQQTVTNSSSDIEKSEIKAPIESIKLTTVTTDEDDDAVIIHSDSENDEDNNNAAEKSKVLTKTQNSILPDDLDEDDCVLIEDDDDEIVTPATAVQNLSAKKDIVVTKFSTPRQRKSLVTVRNFQAFENDDITDIMNDPIAQPPPSKRPKLNTSANNNNVALNLSSPTSGTLTIKDARSLCESAAKSYQQSFLQTTGVSPTHNNNINVAAGKQQQSPSHVAVGKQQQSPSHVAVGKQQQSPSNVFPVAMRPALSPLSNTPMQKLAPVANLVNANATLLPALTDDMFVLEAPSFIVPYIYEKPPSSNLKEMVTQLVTEFDLNKFKDTKENASELDLLQINSTKTDDDKKTKKRKRRPNDKDDDSWDESDESTDDEASDDDSATRTKVLIDRAETNLDIIKSVIAPVEDITAQNKDPLTTSIDLGPDKLKSENYFESPLGKFFSEIGIGLVQEYVQAGLLKIQKRIRKSKTVEQQIQIDIAINALTKNLDTSKKSNEPFKFDLKRCEFCNFKTESALSMANHYETPHMEKNMYKCNFCTFEIRQTQDILFHMEAVHNIKGRLEKAPSYHQCPNCPFEDNGKSKMGRHQPVCLKKFRPELNLCPPQDWEAPAKIPRIKPRHGLVGTATAYQAMAAQAAAQKAALATLQHQQQVARNLIAASTTANRSRPVQITPTTAVGRPNINKVPIIRNVPNNVMNARNTSTVNATPMPIRPISQGNVILPNNYQISGGQLIQVAGSSLAILPNSQNTFTFQSQQSNKKNNNNSGQQPSISITPLPRQSAQQNTTITPSPSVSNIAHQQQPITVNSKAGIKPGQIPSGNKASFVICEICDGYIKDLEQLRNHMQWMHKVKIHPKMIYNRPPLNCQKCQFRFFTDQGLERHLLGSHGLVTSSMQEAANKGKDAGRCPVCGRMYQWKLLNHVSRDHNMTLKPAHLSYKCTVCTATFGMYKQFENHVYTAHSTVAKKAMANDNKKNNNTNINNNNSNNNNISNRSLQLSGTNDSLLKPLRINDEITIIPQPATKKS